MIDRGRGSRGLLHIPRRTLHPLGTPENTPACKGDIVMKIDVIDMDDRVLGTHRRGLAQSSGSTVIEMYGMCNGVSQMVTEIVRVAAPRSIEVLRIWGHGWSGGQLIAAGASAQVGVDHGSALWAHNMAQYGSDLSRLNRYFRAGGRVELKGCQVGSGEAGEAFVSALAKTIGVPVQAAVDIQGGMWVSGQHWNGPIIQSDASGALSCVQGSAL